MDDDVVPIVQETVPPDRGPLVGLVIGQIVAPIEEKVASADQDPEICTADLVLGQKLDDYV